VIALVVVIVAATAAGLTAEHRYREGALLLSRRLMNLVLYVLMPIVAFFNIADLHFTAKVGAGIGFGYVALAASMGAAYVLGKYVLHLSRPSIGTLMGVAALGNTGYLGLPFTAALFGFDEVPNAVAYDLLVSTAALITIGFSVGAAFGTVAERPRDRALAFFTRNPPLWAALLGLLAPDVLAPDWAVEASRLIVVAILPIGFFAVGVTLATEAEEGTTKFPPPVNAPVVTAVALKLLLPPAVLIVLSHLVLDVPDAYISQAAMASGINNLLVSHTYGLDNGLAAAAITWSTAIVMVAGLAVALL
jgi:malate permease and related proteins